MCVEPICPYVRRVLVCRLNYDSFAQVNVWCIFISSVTLVNSDKFGLVYLGKINEETIDDFTVEQHRFNKVE